MCVNSCSCAWQTCLRYSSLSLHCEKPSWKTWGKEIKVVTMHERLLKMMELLDAFIALLGGFCILKELFQMISWAQLNIHEKPIGVLNINGFFNGLLSFIDHAVEQKFIT
ncbi:hypothetical protein PTKIN_Ptkin08bG0086000 [Pterospermum kingtungense]